MKVTVVIPAYHEEKTIGDIIKKTKRHTKNITVVVAKRSRDRTREIAEKEGAKVIIDNGRGLGAAKRIGINTVREGIIVLMDADGSSDPDEIKKLVKPIKEDNYDLVLGSRLRGGSDELHGTFSNFARNVGAGLIQLIVNKRFNVKLTDCENGFRAIKADLAHALKLNADDFDIEEEMVVKALKRGYKVCEVPTHEYERKYGKSNIDLRKIGWKFVWRLIREI